MTAESTALVERARQELEEMEPGYGVLIAEPGQAESVQVLLSSSAWPSNTEILRLPPAPTLGEYNALRDWRRQQGQRIVFVCETDELPRIWEEARDLASTLQFSLAMPWLEGPVDEDEARREYEAWLRRRHGRLDLRGFARSEREDVSWELSQVYEGQRFSNPLERGAPWWPFSTYTAERVGKGRSVVLGHPGSGKTFFLRYLALSALEDGGGPLPILAPLAQHQSTTNGPDLFTRIRRGLAAEAQTIAHLLPELARAGRVRFLLDGLDEVGDEQARALATQQVVELAEQFPKCPIIVSSRITGFDEAPMPDAWQVHRIEPFNDDQIRDFLARWCQLYEVDRLGDSVQARQAGQAEGRRLAREVLGHPQVALLAQTPLLLTVLAMVHRAGLRLPDHRVELYDHITRILVERWNRLRGLASDARALPVQTADALRLLGPLALQTVRSGSHSLINRDELHRACETVLEAGRLRGLGTAQDVLRLFRDELGLLVEQGPGLWGFLHLTLAEYFAALELLRTEGLDRLAKDPNAAFQPQHREILLLAAGELGIRRADDTRLARILQALVRSAGSRTGRPSSVVPSVLAGLLADDPSLDPRSVRLLLEALIPTWWFQRRYGQRRYLGVADEAARSLVPRILAGRHADALREALRERLFSGRLGTLVETMGDAGPAVLTRIVDIGRQAGVDPSPLLLACLDKGGKAASAAMDAWTLRGELRADGVLELRAPLKLDERMRAVDGVQVQVHSSMLVRRRTTGRHTFSAVVSDNQVLLLGTSPRSVRSPWPAGPVLARYRLPRPT